MSAATDGGNSQRNGRKENTQMTEIVIRESPNNHMTNFDHSIPRGMEQRLMDGQVGDYAACNFNCPRVWYDEGKFWAEVWQYGEQEDTISASSLEVLMMKLSDIYGWE